MSAARDELIDLQKRWANDLKRRIFETEGRHNRALDRYYEQYREQFQHGYRRAATRAELGKQLRQADIAYFGDFHTLKIAQKTVATLLGDAADTHGKPVILGLEMLLTEHQRFADDYLAGKLTETEFLNAIEYAKTWGFPWENYRQLFDLARARNWRVLGLNSSPYQRTKALEKRDRHAAKLIASASAFWPQSLVAVLFGDLHVGETHLPARVREESEQLGISPTPLIVYQNSETLYWRLVKAGRAGTVDAVKIKPGVYCVMNATPLVKFQSWINWQETGGELEFSGIGGARGDQFTASLLEEQFRGIVAAIAKYVGIGASGLDNFTLYTTGDLDFMARLGRGGVYSKSELADLAQVIRERNGALFGRARVVYLGSLSINEAARMAGRFIRFNCRPSEWAKPANPRDAFYASVFDDALSAFGVLVINPRWRVAMPSDHRAKLTELRGRKLPDDLRLQRDVSAAAVAHEAAIQKLLGAKRAEAGAHFAYNLEPDRYRAVTRELGNQLGMMLFQAISGSHMEPSAVRALFYATYQPGEAFERYLSLRRDLGKLAGSLRPLAATL